MEEEEIIINSEMIDLLLFVLPRCHPVSDVSRGRSGRLRRGHGIQWEVDGSGGDFEDDDYGTYAIMCMTALMWQWNSYSVCNYCTC